MKLRIALALAILLLTRDVRMRAADPAPEHLMNIVVGRGQLLQFDRDIVRVVVAEPKIADAVIVSPRDVMVTAKGPGHTTVVVWQGESTPDRYEITVTADTTEIEALRLALGAELKTALSDSGVEFSGNAEMIVLSGKAGNIAQSKRAEALAATYTKKVVNLIQVPDPRQILLQVKFADVDRIALQQFGFNLLSRNGTMLGSTGTQQFTAPLFSQLQFQNNQLSGSNVNVANLLNLFLFRPDLGIGATIQALEQQNLAQILAEPNLIVLEGAEASFLAGGEFPFPTIASTPTTGGIAPVVTVQFRKFGVQLNFTPTITASGAIHLKVKPEVSSLDFGNAVTVDGVLIPALSSRYAETEVVLKDGESFAIAGLIDNRVTQIMNKVWLLGDIPVLGYLFRSRSTQKSTDELMVVVTPHIVQPLPPSEKAELPDIVAPYLPTVAEQRAKKNKNKNKKNDQKQPEYVGPRGHEVP
jgi:pilus assembly protein CpaC